MHVPRLAALLLLGLSTLACGSGNAASRVAPTPTAGDAFEAKCTEGKASSSLLIVALSSSEKLKMESRLRSGPLLVQLSGCDVALLSRCSMKGAYRYTGGNLKKDAVAVKNEDELFAKIPIGAASLSTKLRTQGQISVAMATVGRFDSDAATPERAALEGDCAGATHWVSAVTVGAYRMAAGSDAEVAAQAALFGFGAGGSSASSRESLSQDGEGKACEAATDSDTKPPNACGALLRLELQTLKGTQQ